MEPSLWYFRPLMVRPTRSFISLLWAPDSPWRYMDSPSDRPRAENGCSFPRPSAEFFSSLLSLVQPVPKPSLSLILSVLSPPPPNGVLFCSMECFYLPPPHWFLLFHPAWSIRVQVALFDPLTVLKEPECFSFDLFPLTRLVVPPPFCTDVSDRNLSRGGPPSFSDGFLLFFPLQRFS